MKTFNDILDESVKKINGGKVLKINQDGVKLSIAIGQQKDVVNISMNNTYIVLTGKEAKEFMELSK